MATTITRYSHAAKILTGAGDWVANTVKLALVTSGYTPSAAHTLWAEISANEVASGSGYTTGGETLASRSISNDYLLADDVTWTALTKDFRYGVLYISGTIDSIVNPPLAYILYDDTPADVSIGGSNFITEWNINGVMKITP